MTTSSQTELYLPVRSGFKSDNDLHRRQNRAIEEWAKSPFVTNARIQDATITSAKIVSLEVDKITAGSLTADVTVTGLLSAPATTGWRVEIGDATTPIRYWDGTTTNFSLDNAGNVTVKGVITATGGSISGTLDVTGLIRIPATGYRVELGNATYPLRYWDGATTKLQVDTTGAIIASDIIVQQSGVGVTGLQVKAASTSDSDSPAISVQNSVGAKLWQVTNDGEMFFGNSTQGIFVSNNSLRGKDDGDGISTPGQMRAQQGIVTIVPSGGTVTDGDFTVSPENGTLACTNNAGNQKFWVRMSGTWYHVNLT